MTGAQRREFDNFLNKTIYDDTAPPGKRDEWAVTFIESFDVGDTMRMLEAAFLAGYAAGERGT